MEKIQLRPKYWKEDLTNNFKITHIDTSTELSELLKEPILWTSRCSKTKTDTDRALPRDFYVGPLNLLFYEYMEKFKYKYGIISDFYGMIYYDEYVDNYDVHPSALNDEQKVQLGQVIANRAKERGYNKVIFFNTSPVMSRPYFEMLHYSGLDVYYISNIRLLDEIHNKKIQNTLF